MVDFYRHKRELQYANLVHGYVSRLLSIKNIVIGNTSTDVDKKDFWDLCFLFAAKCK